MPELVLPLSRFLPVLAGGPDAIWGKALSTVHGNEKHTASGWWALIEQMRSKPVSYERLRRAVPTPRVVPKRVVARTRLSLRTRA